MWDEEKHCPAPKLHGQQWSGWQDTKSSTTQTTWGEESWWFPYSTHSMKSPFWILTPQSSKSTGRSWVSHGSPAIQGSEVLSRGPAPSPLKSNVMGERGMLLQGVAGVGAQSQTSFSPRHKTYMNPHPADLELSGTHRTAQPRVGKQFLGLGQKPHDPPPPGMVWLLKESLQKPMSRGRPQSTTGSREAQAVLGRAERAIFFSYSYSQESA